MTRRILNKTSILKNSLGLIYSTGLYLLLFELIYKGLILVLFKPILNVIISVFIKAGGYEILVNQEISEFLLSITGILMVIVLMTVAVMVVYYEFSVILLILDAAKKKEKIKLLDITEDALLELKNIIMNKSVGIALYILVLIPFLNVGIQSSLMPTLSIPDFITGEIDKYPGTEYLVLIVILALVFLFAKLFVVLPVMVFSEKSFKQASRISWKTIKGEGFQIAFIIIGGMIIWLAMAYLPFLLLENVEFILFRILRTLSNVSLALFTLLISPFILSISLETYNQYVELGDINREEVDESLKLGYLGKKIWAILEIILKSIQNIILRAMKHRKTLVAFALFIIILFNVYSEESVRPLFDEQLLIGHRGGEYGVENTIGTILFAGTNGADYVEMDVLLTKDNIPVVIHDNSLKRLANLSQSISDLTFDEISKITIKSADLEDSIPSLEELAREVKGKTKLLLEFKTHGKEEKSIVDITIDILEKEGILDETIFHTSELRVINEFNEKYPELSMGYVFIGKIGTFSAKKMANLPVDFISAEESLINKKMIREVHKSGKAVFAWTINDDYKAERLFELGVDGIITDYPVEMIPIRDKYKEYNEME